MAGRAEQTCLLIGRHFSTGVQAAAVASTPGSSPWQGCMQLLRPVLPDLMQLCGQKNSKAGACLLPLLTHTHLADLLCTA